MMTHVTTLRDPLAARPGDERIAERIARDPSGLRNLTVLLSLAEREPSYRLPREVYTDALAAIRVLYNAVGNEQLKASDAARPACHGAGCIDCEYEGYICDECFEPYAYCGCDCEPEDCEGSDYEDE